MKFCTDIELSSLGGVKINPNLANRGVVRPAHACYLMLWVGDRKKEEVEEKVEDNEEEDVKKESPRKQGLEKNVRAETPV